MHTRIDYVRQCTLVIRVTYNPVLLMFPTSPFFLMPFLFIIYQITLYFTHIPSNKALLVILIILIIPGHNNVFIRNTLNEIPVSVNITLTEEMFAMRYH